MADCLPVEGTSDDPGENKSISDGAGVFGASEADCCITSSDCISLGNCRDMSRKETGRDLLDGFST